jgi:hypothetical protein
MAGDPDLSTLLIDPTPARPSYPGQSRRHLVFLLPSALLLMLSALVSLDHVAGLVALNLGVTLAAISVVEQVWISVGGEPLARAILDLRSATATLKDLDRTGIARLHGSRQNVMSELVERWTVLLLPAKTVDLLGFTLYQQWFAHEPLVEGLRQVILRNDGKVRILLFDSDASDPSSSIAHRMNQPGEEKMPFPSTRPSQRIIRCAPSPRGQPPQGQAIPT